MTAAQAALVQSSFRKILPMGEQAAALFYARLFELNPGLRAQFRGDLHDEGSKLIATLATAVLSLEGTSEAEPVAEERSPQPPEDRVSDQHDSSIRAALHWTLQKGLGPEFTPAVCAAWTAAYALLVGLLLETLGGTTALA